MQKYFRVNYVKKQKIDEKSTIGEKPAVDEKPIVDEKPTKRRGRPKGSKNNTKK